MSASGSPAIVAAPPSRSPQRKSPPPPPLNLDELKTRFASVPAYHAPPAVATPGNGATSFVFTSSRTKQLQQPLGPPFASTSTSTSYGARPASPNRLRRSGSPVSPAASTSTASTVRNHQYTKPALSPSQLARHGEGAMDSRRILGPNMRAAGFVHLSNSVKSNSGSAATSPASSPGWQEIPGPSNYMGTTTVQLTPTDPPPFPPIMFVPPTAVQHVSMWDYQRWPPARTPAAASPSIPTHVHPHPQDGAHSYQGRSMSESHVMTGAGLGIAHARTHSHSPFSFNTESTAASISSGPSLAQTRSVSFSSSSTMFSPGSRGAADKGKDRECDGLEVLEEYPFPRTPPSPSSRASDSSGSVSGAGGRASEQKRSAVISSAHSSRTDSPEFASNAARSHNHSSHSHTKTRAKDKDRDRPKEHEKPKDKRKSGHRAATLLTERTREQMNVPRAARTGAPIAQPHAQSRAYELSFSELCEPGFAWSSSNVDIFAPVSGPRALSSTTESPSPPTDPEKASPERSSESAEEPAPALASVPAEKERHREQRREEKKHIAGLVAAHRERDEDHVRYVAAEREREEREGRKDREKEKEKEEKEKEKGKERARRMSGCSPKSGSPKGSGRASPLPVISITKEREHRERERTSPGHKERKSRRHSPKHLHAVHAMHKTKSIFSDITSVSDAETMVGEANASAAGDVLAA